MAHTKYTQADIVLQVRKVAANLEEYSRRADLFSAIKEIYDIEVDKKVDPECVRALYSSLQRINSDIVRQCGIKSLSFEDLGPSKEYYPNHGKYVNNTLILNSQLLNDPHLIVDPDNRSILNKFDQTLYHELGHGWDEFQGEDGELCLKDEWLTLSGWSKYPKPGYKRIHIKEPGTPEIVGDYYYSPYAKFTRFYAKRNPWDDWADCFSYYVGGAKSYLPRDKKEYFDKILKKTPKGDKR